MVNWQVPHNIRSSRLSRKQIAMIRKLLSIGERKPVMYLQHKTFLHNWILGVDLRAVVSPLGDGETLIPKPLTGCWKLEREVSVYGIKLRDLSVLSNYLREA